MEKLRTRNILFVVLIGIVVFTVFIAEIGLGRSMHLMSNINKTLIPIMILLNILNSIAFTISWKFLIPGQISFYKLFTFYIAGTFINNITPAFGAGGEPVKAILLGNETGISKAECFAGVVSQRLLSIFPFLVIELIGIGLLFRNPALVIGRWEMPALVFSVIFGICAFGLLAYFYTRKDKLSSFVRLIIRFSAPLIRPFNKDFTIVNMQMPQNSRLTLSTAVSGIYIPIKTVFSTRYFSLLSPGFPTSWSCTSFFFHLDRKHT